jgi:hypothetical protein
VTATVDIPHSNGVLRRIVIGLASLVLGTVLAMTAVTSVWLLGWQVRKMRATALRHAGLAYEVPGFVMGSANRGLVVRLLGGLASNLRSGVLAAASLLLATAPFTVIWLLSWWAGWENSFSKGYEQAFVGPALGLAGVALFCIIMIWLPMALAHQAVEDRAMALFEWRLVQSAVRHSGWGYLALALATVFFSMPVFAGRGLVAFSSAIVPGFDDYGPDQIARLQNAIIWVKAVYVFLFVTFLRLWSARIYASSIARALDGLDAMKWKESSLSPGRHGGKRPWRLTHWLRVVLLGAIWLVLATQIFIAQFLNHDWYVWLTHPFVFLPWAI